MIRAFLAGVVTLLALCGCQSPTTPPTNSPAVTATLAAGSCHLRMEDGQPLPDPACTPGALNPNVTQATIGSTICRLGWTKTIRPSVAYTDALKRRGIVAYGYSDKRMGAYEEDHLVPLELAGNPTAPTNLWPQPGGSPNGKDLVEGTLNHAVCAGKVSLAAAQNAIAKDWVTAESVLGLK